MLRRKKRRKNIKRKKKERRKKSMKKRMEKKKIRVKEQKNKKKTAIKKENKREKEAQQHTSPSLTHQRTAPTQQQHSTILRPVALSFFSETVPSCL